MTRVFRHPRRKPLRRVHAPGDVDLPRTRWRARHGEVSRRWRRQELRAARVVAAGSRRPAVAVVEPAAVARVRRVGVRLHGHPAVSVVVAWAVEGAQSARPVAVVVVIVRVADVAQPA